MVKLNVNRINGVTSDHSGAILLLTIITFNFLRDVAAHNVSSVQHAKARNRVGGNHHGHILHCYFCRSDHNSDCLNRVSSSWEEFSAQCTDENVHAFYNLTQTDHIKHPLPKYIDRQGGGGGAGGNVWACYTLFSTDGLFTFRACAAHPKATDKHNCHACTVPNSDNRPAKCCICGTSFCNDKSSGAFRPISGTITGLQGSIVIIVSSLLSLRHILSL